MPRAHNHRGFTLIELLITIGILAVLATLTVLVINPVEIFRQTRDTQRTSDLKTLQRMFGYAEIAGSYDKDGSYGGSGTTDSCVGETNSRIFVSVPNDNGETPPAPPVGWTMYQQVSSSQLRKVDGAGWIPVNFQSVAAGLGSGSLISSLPVDPTNTFESGLYYSYTCGSYALTAKLESEKYTAAQASDGGSYPTLLEVANDFAVVPPRPTAAAGPTPTIESINPSSGPASGPVSITSITGSNFSSGASVALTKSGQSTITGTGFSVAGATSITGGSFNLSGAATGLWNVVVTNPDSQTGTLPSGFTVTSAPNAPTISTFTPTSGVNTGAVTLTSVTGTNFASGATVKLTRSGQSDINCTGVNFTNTTTLSGGSCPITSAVAGFWNVVVTNPDTQSATLTNGFTVTGTTPTVTDITPGSGVNTGSVSLTSVTGTNFTSGTTVKLTKSGQTNITCTGVTFTNTTTLSGGSCPISGAATGLWNVLITRPDTVTATLTDGFTVSAPAAAPTVTAINPTTAVTGATATLTTVNGTNFVSGATVKLTKSGQSDITCTGVSFSNSTTLSGGSCNLTSAVTGDWNVVVTNPDSQTGTYTNGFNVGNPPTGILAEWEFNEGSGTTAADATGNGNTGTVSNTTWTTGYLGTDSALSFNGTNSSVKMAGSSNVNVTGDITVSFWVNPALGNDGVVVHKDNQYTFIINSNGTVSWADSSNWSYVNFGQQSVGIVANQWQQLTITKTGGVVKIYRNGNLQLSQAFGGSLTSTSNIMHIGCYSTATSCTGNQFSGKIDSVRIYNQALSASEVAALYTPPQTGGLVSKWSFDTNTGTTATDSAGSNTATLNGGVSWVTGYDGTGYALSFSGLNSSMTTANSVASPGPVDFTLVTWFKTTTAGGGKLIGFGDSQVITSNGYDRHIYMTNSGTLNFGTYNGSTQIISTTNAYNDGSWHQVAASLSSTGGQKLYIDGFLVASNAAYTTAQAYTGWWRIAYDNLVGWPSSPSSHYFNGSLDDIRIYDIALSASEVAALYTPPQSSGLLARWTLNETSGTSAADASGNGNLGSLTGGPTWTTVQARSGVSLDGNNDYVDLGTAGSLNFSAGQTFTVSAWVKTTDAYGAIVSMRNTANDGSIVDLMVGYNGATDDAGKFVAIVRQDSGGGGYATANSATSIDDNVWHHVAMTRETGGVIKVYVDGLLKSSGNGSEAAGAITTNERAIGAELEWQRTGYASGPAVPGERWLNGVVDDVRIYDHALTAGEILTLSQN